MTEKKKAVTLSEDLMMRVNAMKEFSAGNEITDLQYDNAHALCITNSSEGEYSDSVCSDYMDDDRFSAQAKRDTLLRHTRQDSASAVLRTERIIERLDKTNREIRYLTWLAVLVVVLNGIALYKVW